MRYIKGRSNLSCTIFVPWDCNNHCKFCTSKQMYKQRTCDIDAILAQIKKLNENPLIEEFVLTGGEPLADIEKCQILIDAMKKPVYINTTFPTFTDLPGTVEMSKIKTLIDFINNNEKIGGLNISRHMHQQFYEPVLPLDMFAHLIKKHIKLNVVLSKEFDINEFKTFIEPYKELENISICIRADYRNITKDNLKNRDDVFEKLILEYEYESSGGCMVCNDDRFWNNNLLISYHRGMEHSKVVYGNKIFVNDILITIDGQVYDDWDLVTNTEFERWVFGEYSLTDDISEYENDPVYVDWLLKKNGEEGIL